MTFSSEAQSQTLPEDFAVSPVQQIRAIVFDAVGTLIYPSPSVAVAYQQAIHRHCGIDTDPEMTLRIVKNALQTRSSDADLTASEAGERQFWAELIHQLCPDSDGFQACFDDLFAHFGNAAHWRCFPDVGNVIHSLTSAGLEVAIASNFDLRLNSVCDGLHELAGISRRIISSQVGWRKPAQQFFDAVAQELQLPREHILMVGDDLQNDILGAVSSGLPSAWICRDSGSEAHLPQGAVRLNSLSQLPPYLRLATAPFVDSAGNHGVTAGQHPDVKRV